MVNAIAEEIEISNIAPIESVRIPVRPEGGVVLLTGPQGCGKSHALEAINALVTGKGSLEKRDGSHRGTVQFGEARISIVKQVSRNSAELAITGIDGGVDLEPLIDPRIKDPEKADAARIKKIVQLGGITPDIALFHELATDKAEFDEIVGPDACESDDVVAMAARVKRDFEAASRKAESLAETYTGTAIGHREAALGYDASVESDASVLQARLETAIRDEQRLESEQGSAAQLNERIAKARTAIKAAMTSNDIPTVVAATEAEEQAAFSVQQANEEVRLLTESLREARVKLAKAEAAHASAVNTRKAAAQHWETIEALRETAELETVDFDEHQLVAARDQVTQARQAVEQGALQRDKAVRQAKAETADRMALEARKKAERLRESAKSTDEILSGLVARCGTDLRVERGRIVTTTDRGTEAFGDLSDGERATIGIKIGVTALERMGVPDQLRLLTLPQRFWGELQPKVRQQVHEYALQCRVTVVTALATDDDGITAELFSAS